MNRNSKQNKNSSKRQKTVKAAKQQDAEEDDDSLDYQHHHRDPFEDETLYEGAILANFDGYTYLKADWNEEIFNMLLHPGHLWTEEPMNIYLAGTAALIRKGKFTRRRDCYLIPATATANYLLELHKKDQETLGSGSCERTYFEENLKEIDADHVMHILVLCHVGSRENGHYFVLHYKKEDNFVTLIQVGAVSELLNMYETQSSTKFGPHFRTVLFSKSSLDYKTNRLTNHRYPLLSRTTV